MSDDGAIERACTTCLLCLRDSYGYSNYTVEGTSLSCLKGLNPALNGEDEPYGEPTPELAAALDVAKTCPSYRQGAPASLDVERDALPYPRTGITPRMILKAGYTDDKEAAKLLAETFNV